MEQHNPFFACLVWPVEEIGLDPDSIEVEIDVGCQSEGHDSAVQGASSYDCSLIQSHAGHRAPNVGKKYQKTTRTKYEQHEKYTKQTITLLDYV